MAKLKGRVRGNFLKNKIQLIPKKKKHINSAAAVNFAYDAAATKRI